MNDIRPPRRPTNLPVTPPVVPQEPVVSQVGEQPTVVAVPDQLPTQAAAIRKRRPWPWIVLCAAVLLIMAAIVGVLVWYNHELTPVTKQSLSTTRVTIAPSTTPSQIAQLLHDKSLIRSELAFTAYARISGKQNKLQAGTYNLSPAYSTPEIIDHLVRGKTDTMRITFLPGVALWPNPQTPDDQRTDVESVLLRVGFQKTDVETALTKQYNHPLLSGRPAGADIEGYIYGETYDFNSNATLDDIFNKVFDTFYDALQKNNTVAGLQQHGLSLYQGITLASIVQREVSAPDASLPSHDQQQVAQVFLTRLAGGVSLGSDASAYYGAIKARQAPTVAVDTPYNTRIHTGLPPGPIATPSIGALEAVANPAPGDYLFFVSGDDGVTYFAHTEAEHQANVNAHCHVKCDMP